MRKKYFISGAAAFGAACLLAAGAAATSCSHKSDVVIASAPKPSDFGGEDLPVPVPIPGEIQNSRPVSARLRASLFKMSGDYADHVAVTIGPDGKLSYFPAPTDLSDDSAPVEVGDGWWLNRQGLGPNSVFTKWTFNEYRALKSVPTTEEIKAAVIPGARVTAFEQLTLPASEAKGLAPADLLKYLPQSPINPNSPITPTSPTINSK